MRPGPATVFALAVRGVAPTAPQAVVSAGVTAATADPVNANNTATGPVTVRPVSDSGQPGPGPDIGVPDPTMILPTADMAVTVTKPRPVRSGGSGVLTVAVANNGPNDAGDATGHGRTSRGDPLECTPGGAVPLDRHVRSTGR
nr:hypothetical protein GCM10020092_097310 [Actinoplanes digitatis]